MPRKKDFRGPETWTPKKSSKRATDVGPPLHFVRFVRICHCTETSFYQHRPSLALCSFHPTIITAFVRTTLITMSPADDKGQGKQRQVPYPASAAQRSSQKKTRRATLCRCERVQRRRDHRVVFITHAPPPSRRIRWRRPQNCCSQATLF